MLTLHQESHVGVDSTYTYLCCIWPTWALHDTLLVIKLP